MIDAGKGYGFDLEFVPGRGVRLMVATPKGNATLRGAYAEDVITALDDCDDDPLETRDVLRTALARAEQRRFESLVDCDAPYGGAARTF